MRRLTGAAMIIIGAGAFAACLRFAIAGMRDVMIKDGGGWSADGATAAGATRSPVDAIPQPAEPSARVNVGMWLAASAVGAAAGLALSPSLVSLLR